MGKSLVFVILKRGQERLQVSLHRKELLASSDVESKDFTTQVAGLNLGDIVSVEGFPGKTHTGELTLMARKIECLAPCLHPLPKHQGLSDEVLQLANGIAAKDLTICRIHGTRRDTWIFFVIRHHSRLFKRAQGSLRLYDRLWDLPDSWKLKPQFYHSRLEEQMQLLLRLNQRLYKMSLFILGLPLSCTSNNWSLAEWIKSLSSARSFAMRVRRFFFQFL